MLFAKNYQNLDSVFPVPAHHSQGPPLPGSATPTVGHWVRVRDRVRVRVKYRVRVRDRVRVRVRVKDRVRVRVRVVVRVRRTVGVADPGSGGPWEWRTGIVFPVHHYWPSQLSTAIHIKPHTESESRRILCLPCPNGYPPRKFVEIH